MSLKFIDVFSGIGGFRIAADSLGLKCVESIEYDPNCQENYYLNFGNKPLGDITTLNLSSLPEHDLLLAGFPCQPFSRNGKYNRNNKSVVSSDSRKDLFLQLVEILKLKKPRFFIFENVKELLTILDDAGQPFIERIVKAVDDAGYSISYTVLNSNDFGLAQQRNRVYIVGIRKDCSFNYTFPKPLNNIRKVSDILLSNVEDKYLLKNRWAKRLVSEPENKQKSYKGRNHGVRIGGPRLEALEEIYLSPKKNLKKSGIIPLAVIYGETPSGLPRQQDKLYSVKGVSPTLTTFELVVPAFDIGTGKDTWRVLTPRECARLQGFPDNFILAEEDSIAYKQLGNAVSIPVVRAVLQNLIKDL